MKCLGEIEASEEKTRCGLKGVDRVGYIKTASLQQHTLIRRRLQLLHPKRDFWCVLRDLMVLVMFVEVVSYVSGSVRRIRLLYARLGCGAEVVPEAKNRYRFLPRSKKDHV